MVHRNAVAAIAILALLVTSALVPADERRREPAEIATAYTPAESFVHFFRAVNKGRLHDAERMMAHFPSVQRQFYQRELERIATAMADGYRPVLVASMQLDDCAAVVFEDDSPRRTRVDLDPAYFLRRNGRWMIMPEVARFDGQWDDLTTAQADNFEALQSWFKDSKRTMSKMVDESRQRRRDRVRTRR